MKSTGVILICLLGVSFAEKQCVNDGDLLANPDDCNTFFECVGGEKILMPCPPGSEWWDEQKRCDLPEFAHCSSSNTTTTPASHTTEDPQQTTTGSPRQCENDDDLFPNPEDCTTFFKCFNGELILFHCPPGQEWAERLHRCEFPEVAQCSTGPTTPGGETTTGPSVTTKKPPVECHEEGELLPDPESCSNYYWCTGGIPFLEKCPEGLLWNDKLKECDWPENVKCP